MGVFIKGIKIPDDCWDCYFFTADDECYFQESKDTCPLVEVKEPHGRLIDADALKSKFRHGEGDSDVDSAWISTIRRFLTQADTIIEAEGREE